MFTSEAIIDAVQNGKNFRQHIRHKRSCERSHGQLCWHSSWIHQKAVKVGQDTAAVLASEMVKTMQQATKFDYSKFGEGIMKAYQTTQKPAKGA